jgi:hypothetical protein
MGITQQFVVTAIECVRTPGRTSVWSKRLGRYVCNRDPEFETARREQHDVGHAPIGQKFKLIF